MTTALITHPACLQHEMGPHHPESPARLQSVLRALETSGLSARMEKVEAPAADEETLSRAHDPNYVASIFSSSPIEDYAYLDPMRRLLA